MMQETMNRKENVRMLKKHAKPYILERILLTLPPREWVSKWDGKESAMSSPIAAYSATVRRESVSSTTCI